MAAIIWTESAVSDIESIAAYISNDSLFYASKFVAKIFLAAEKLERHPLIGKVVRELPNHEYREILFQKYRIIYRVQGGEIYIVSVHHSARLLSNNDFFKELFE